MIRMLLVVVRMAYDLNRASGILYHCLGYATEQEPNKAAVPVRSHEHKIGPPLFRFLDDARPGIPLYGNRVGSQAPFAQALRYRLNERLRGFILALDERL